MESTSFQSNTGNQRVEDMKTTVVVVVEFYSADEVPYGVLSNFYMKTITMNNKVYQSIEHFFQSQKFIDQEYKERIRMTKTPYQAKLLGCQQIDVHTKMKWRLDLNKVIQEFAPSVRIRPDWEEIKEDIMYDALRAKFTQHRELGQLLKNTKEKQIREVSPYDSYWGIGRNKRGRNRLGCLLMRLRKELFPKN